MKRWIGKRRFRLKTRRPRFEALESRCLLDAGLATLVDDVFTLRQNGSVQTLDVLANDRFDEGVARRISAVSFGNQGGRIEIVDNLNGNGHAIGYMPPADFFGEETFVYFVGNQSATVTVSIQSPVRFDHYELVPDGVSHRLDVLDNDPFWDDYPGARRITSVSETRLGGTVTNNGDGSLTYTPPEFAFGKDNFVYVVDDRYPAQVEITIPNPLRDDRYPNIVMNSPAQDLNVLANDPFWNGYSGAKQITLVGEPSAGGRVEIADGGRSLRYRPAGDFSGWERFTYVVDQAFEARVELQVHRPVRDDYFELDANSRDHAFDLTTNDYYEYYPTASSSRIRVDVVDRITSVGQSEQGGTVAIADHGQGVIYSAPEDFRGTDTFTYVADGLYEATVTVRLTNPVRDDYYHRHNLEVYQDSVGNRLSVLSNDFRGNGYDGPKLISDVSATDAGGTVTIAENGKSILYDPPAGHIGRDRFTYTVDGQFEAQVSLWVEPRAEDDRYQFCSQHASQPQELHVLANDRYDINYSGPGIITSVSETENGGTVAISDDGRHLLFTAGDSLRDSFTYTVDDRYEAMVSVSFAPLVNYSWSDRAVVDQNSSDNAIDVLNNDVFGNYQSNLRDHWQQCAVALGGPLRPSQVTAVGPSEHGGQVTINDGGSGVSYTPPPDFHGPDTFRYTVDGAIEATVWVNVVRRVRDDVFHVAADSSRNDLPVLINDLFGADYAGSGRITAVTAAAAGGTLEITGDGDGLAYTPPTGFVGQDSFTYTVDGRLLADVTVVVGRSLDEQLPRFDSLAAFEQFLIDDAVRRYESQFGQPAYPYIPWASEDAAFSVALSVMDASIAERSHSETNVQVAGVDEADIIETDGDYLYIVREGELVIADAWPAAELSVVSRLDIAGVPVGEYLNGDRLTIVSQEFNGRRFPPVVIDDLDSEIVAPGLIDTELTIDRSWYPPPQPKKTIVTVLNVADRQNPTVIQTTELDGQYVESRRINDNVFVVLRNDRVELPRPETICDGTIEPSDDFLVVDGPTCRYESEAEYVARIRAEMGALLEDVLPHYTSYTGDGEVARTGLLTAPTDILQPIDENARTLVSVASIDMANDQPGLRAATGIFSTGADKIYGSLENLYVFDDAHSNEDGAVTRIMQFRWDGSNGDVQFVARGQVAGRMLNQFSADEFDGYLRIATTISNAHSGNWTGRSENVLFVFQEDHGVLEPVGGLQNLALDESIRSVRFMGDRAFVTTFRDIDPLFAVDLTEPATPRAIGHITMPGFNSYMQLIDDDRLLAVGRNTPQGLAGPTQVVLFDVSDLAQPRIIENFTFERFSTSEAELDHHAFGWFAQHQTLVMPSTRGFWQRVDEDGDGYRESRQWVREDQLNVFTIDVNAEPGSGQAIVLRGEIHHDSPVRRGVFIDDVLYSVATDSVVAADIQDPAMVHAEIRLDTEDGEYRPGDNQPEDNQPGDRSARALETARGRLAAQLGIAAESALLVAAEMRGSRHTAGHFVFGVGDRHYRIAVEGESEVGSIDSQFTFDPPGGEVSLQNADDPEDVNGDRTVTPVDVLQVINDLNINGIRTLAHRRVLRQVGGAVRWLDVNGDGRISPVDVVRVINRLNGETTGNDAEGESDGRGRVVSPPPATAPSASLPPLAASSGSSTLAGTRVIGVLSDTQRGSRDRLPPAGVTDLWRRIVDDRIDDAVRRETEDAIEDFAEEAAAFFGEPSEFGGLGFLSESPFASRS